MKLKKVFITKLNEKSKQYINRSYSKEIKKNMFIITLSEKSRCLNNNSLTGFYLQSWSPEGFKFVWKNLGPIRFKFVPTLIRAT